MPVHPQKYIRRMNTKASNAVMADEDVRLVVNAEYDSVLGGLKKTTGYSQVGNAMTAYSSVLIDTDTEWDAGTHTNTEASSDILQLEGGSLFQDSYDDSYQMYGNNQIAMKFSAAGPSVTRIGAYLDKVEQTPFATYDNFNDNSIDGSLWSTWGSPEETGGKMVLVSTAPSEEKIQAKETNFDGVKWTWNWDTTNGVEGESDNNLYVQLSGNGLTIKVWMAIQANLNVLQVNGTDVKNISGTYHTWDLKPDGDDVKIYVDGSHTYTVSGSNFGGAGTLSIRGHSHKDTEGIWVDNVGKYVESTALSDITYEIQPDSGSAPSGSAISNGTGTISSGDVTTSTELIEEALSTSATTTVDSDYWLVLSQTGGDSYTYYRVYKENSDVYSDGNILVSSDGGSSWSADPDNSGNTDMAFRVYFGYQSSGNWLSDSQSLSSGQTLSQLKLQHQDLSSTEKITQVDITDTSGSIQSSYTSDISTGSQTTLRGSDFDSGFSYTNGNSFKVKLSLVSSGGSQTPGVKSVSLDTPETRVQELKPLYQGSSGTKNLMAIIAGTVKKLASNTWNDVKDDLTSGVETQATIFRASKAGVETSGTADSGTLTTLVDTPGTEPATNEYQGYFVKITGGTGKGQVRVIQHHTGTSTSTSTSTTTSTSTSTTTTTSTTTSTT